MSINIVVISAKPTSSPFLLFSKKNLPYCFFMAKMPIFTPLGEIPNIVLDDYVEIRSFKESARKIAKVCKRDVEYVFMGRLKWDREGRKTYMVADDMQEIPREEEHFMEGSRKIFKLREPKPSRVKPEDMDEAVESGYREMRRKITEPVEPPNEKEKET